jgi:hypothetical protein
MLGLMVLLGISGLALLVWAGMWFAQRRALATGAAPNVARRWKWGVLGAVLLLIFWDWVPTWIAYEYYSRQAGLHVLKTLEQWEKANPGVAETLDPYRDYAGDKRSEPIRLPNGVSRYPLNARFAFANLGSQYVFLSVRLWTYELVDQSTNEVLARYVHVVSGNSGGVATGGEGWMKFWLIHGETLGHGQDYANWQKILEGARNIGERK